MDTHIQFSESQLSQIREITEKCQSLKALYFKLQTALEEEKIRDDTHMYFITPVIDSTNMEDTELTALKDAVQVDL